MVELLIRWIMIALLTVAAIWVNRAVAAYDRKLASTMDRSRRDELTNIVIILFFSVFMLVVIVGTGSGRDITWALPFAALFFGGGRLVEAWNWVRLQRQLR